MKSKSLPISVLAILLGVSLSAFSLKMQAEGYSKNTVKDAFNPIQQTNYVEFDEFYEQENFLENEESDLGWTSRGPVNIGGCVQAILIDNQDATNRTIYVGSKSGGIRKSTDGGLNWTMINYDENLFVTSLEQTDNGVIYIGTGGKFVGTGLYKLTNNVIEKINGSEWESINDLASIGNNLYIATNEGLFFYNGSDFVEKIDGNVYEVKTNTAGKIIASVDKVCYVSQGVDSEFVSQAEKFPAASSISTLSLAVDDFNANIFYACLAKAGGNTHGALRGIYMTMNAGETWETILQGGGSVDPFVYNGQKYGAEHNKIFSINSMPGNNALYVAAHDIWLGFRPTTVTSGYFDFGTDPITYSLSSYTYPFYLHSFVYDIETYSTTAGTIVLLATEGGVFKTVIPQSGIATTFAKLNITLDNVLINNIAVDGNDHPICGTDGTSVLLSGKLSNGLNMASSAWSISTASGEYSLEGYSHFNFPSMIYSTFYFYSQTDNRTFSCRRSFDNGLSYTDITGVMPAGTIKDVLHWETFNAAHTPDTVVFHAYKKTDSTISTHYNNWNPGDVVFANSNSSYTQDKKYPIPFVLEQQLIHGDSVLVPDVIQTRTFVAADKKVYMTDGILDFSVDPTWITVATVTDTVLTLALSAECEDLFFGTTAGKIYRIPNIDMAYVDTTKPDSMLEIASFENARVTSISVDKADRNHVVVTLQGDNLNDYIYESTNATSETPTFNSIQNNLPKQAINTSLIPVKFEGYNRISQNMILIGTDDGVWTKEGNGDWTQDQTVKNIKVTKLIQQSLIRESVIVPSVDPANDTLFINNYYPASINNGSIYAATYGKGFYQSDIFKTAPVSIINDGNESNEISQSLMIYPNPVSATANIEINVESTQDALLQVFDIQGRCMTNQKVRLQKGNNVHEVNFTDYNAGIYIVRLVYGSDMKTAKVIKNH